MNRRDLMAAMAAAPVLATQVAQVAQAQETTPAPETPAAPSARRGRLKQSVMFQVWGNPTVVIPDNNPTNQRRRFEILQRQGFHGVDLITAAQVPIAREYGLEPVLMQAATGGTSQAAGAIRATAAQFTATVSALTSAASLGCPNVIVLPGELRGMSREDAATGLIDFLRRLAPEAEARGVNVVIEPTNNRIAADLRLDTAFNNLDWGINVLRQVNSPRVKLLFDFYHTQVQEGDVTRRFLQNLDLIAHIQVAGVPSRKEIDDTQELNYRYIAKVIADSGYTGYVGHEHYFVNPPGGNAVEEVERSLARCYDTLVV